MSMDALFVSWLSLVGSVLLLIGTGAQAVSAMLDVSNIPKELRDNFLNTLLGPRLAGPYLDYAARMGGGWFAKLIKRMNLFTAFKKAVFDIPHNLKKMSQEGYEQQRQVRHYYRLAISWTLLMVGSLLVLAAAVIQLTTA
jgi:hypothetical protein